ncbi:tRNA pseudouridine synthase Pus10-like [Ostrea edulis]|uniref:tRNA pseudouridine synthase Pus10-like n=1 Tax=Ostrea edulis TaxID=37623 RepID=UPI0024AF144E|nr:tRNA pseudouridine synthase Pus10-like [Ostrea edulis]
MALSFNMAAPMCGNFFSTDPTETKEIVHLLTQNGLCPRCVLRFLGVGETAVFRSSTEELTQKVISLAGGQEDIFSSLPCPACLGILQVYLENEFINRIAETVQSNDHEFKTFICSLTTPVCSLLREHAFLLLLREKFKALYDYKVVEDIASVKDVWKWKSGPILAGALNAPFENKSKFDIILNFTYEKSDKECSFLSYHSPEVFRKRKKQQKNYGDTYTRTNVTKVLSDMTDGYFQRNYSIPKSSEENICKCDEIRCVHDAVYVAGRYNKYSRTLSQTPWMLDGGRKSQSSVEEEICGPLKQKFRFTEQRFSSSGREDVDVRMLGKGRPFVVEMDDPHRVQFTAQDLLEIQKEINKSADVKVRDLQIVDKIDVNKLKEGEIEKTKTYFALCWSKEPLSQEQLTKLNDVKDLVIYQKTPIRVLHRRPLATRERVVYSMAAEKVDDLHFNLSLSTQAGTYIKEFVHGDFGRTTPNLGTLMEVECDILELDVQSVELDWPPSLGDS